MELVDKPVVASEARATIGATFHRLRSETVRVVHRPPTAAIDRRRAVGPRCALLIDRDAVIEVADFLRPVDFYRQANATVYDAIIELYDRREPIDIVTVSEILERRGALEQVGGSAYLTSLINLTPTAVNAVYYGRIVERKAVLRNLIGAAGKIAAIGYDDQRGRQRVDRPRGAGALTRSARGASRVASRR